MVFGNAILVVHSGSNFLRSKSVRSAHNVTNLTKCPRKASSAVALDDMPSRLIERSALLPALFDDLVQRLDIFLHIFAPDECDVSSFTLDDNVRHRINAITRLLPD